MNLKHKITILGIAVLLGLAGFFVTAKIINSQPRLSSAATLLDKDGNQIQEVMLKDGAAYPNTLTLELGQTMRVNSADGKTHSLSLGKGGEAHDHLGAFNSGEFGADEAWEVQFGKSATYYFHDHKNPSINLLVVVYKQR